MYKTFIKKETGEWARFELIRAEFHWFTPEVPKLYSEATTLDSLVAYTGGDYEFFTGYELIDIQIVKM